MNVACTTETCPLVLNSKCVFYESSALPYIGVATNDSIQVSLQKIEAAVKAIVDAGGGGGAVDSVNGQVGVVVLNAGDIGAAEAGDNISIFTNDAGYLTSASTVFWRVNGTTTLNSGDTIVNHTGGLGSDLLFQRSGNTLFGITSSPASAFFGDKSQNYIQVIAGGGLVVYDPRVTPLGIIYQQDFSATFIDRSLIDRGFADNTYWKVAGSSVISDQGGALVELPYTEGGVSLDSYIKIASYWTTDPTFRAELSIFGINDGLGSAEIGFDLSAANGTARDGIRANVSTITMYGEDGAGQSVTFAITNSTPTCVFTDDRTVKKGIQYAATGYVTDPLSLTTKEYVDAIVGGGITNTAAANEMMKSDGTNAVPSGIFSTVAGDLTMGTGLAGAARVIQATGSAAEVGLNIKIKGNSANMSFVGGSASNLEFYFYDGTNGRHAFNNRQGFITPERIMHVRDYNSAGTNVVLYPFRVGANHLHNPITAGVGVGIEFETRTTFAGNFEIGSSILSLATDITPGSENFDILFSTMTSGALVSPVVRMSALTGVDILTKLQVNKSTLGTEVLKLTTNSTNDDPNITIYQNRVATTNATPTTLHTYTLPISTTVKIKAEVVARRTGGAAGTAEDGAGYVFIGTYKNVAGTATIIGAISTLYTAESQAGWDATFTLSGSDILVTVTGATDNNITWHLSKFEVETVGS